MKDKGNAVINAETIGAGVKIGYNFSLEIFEYLLRTTVFLLTVQD